MSQRLMAAVFVMMCTAMPVLANWGDSLEQCIKQYGKPTNKFLDDATGKVKAAVFSKDDLVITIAFRDEKAVGLDYRGKEGATISTKQILQILLEHETAEGRFYPVPSYEEPAKPLPAKEHATQLESTIRYQSWVRSDQKLMATFVKDKAALKIIAAPKIAK